jgi:excisionase family DNA binding protein
MTAAQSPPHAPDVIEGMVIPPHLVEPCLMLLRAGEWAWERQNGGFPRRWDLPGLHKILAAARASASGRPPAILGSQARTPDTTTGEAARVMGISERRVRQLAAAGRLIARKRGRDWLIDRQSAEDYRRPERTR